MLGHLSMPGARLTQHEFMWVQTFILHYFILFKNVYSTSHSLCFSQICSLSAIFGAWNALKSSEKECSTSRVLLYFTPFLSCFCRLLSVRTPPWRCGSRVLRWQHLRLDCLCGVLSLVWLSEAWHPVGTATSKSRCVWGGVSSRAVTVSVV